jgi:hypothetical protein
MHGLTQNQAIAASLAIAEAMKNNDKEMRELAYASMDVEDLKRVLRWQTRNFLNTFAVLCLLQDNEFEEAWKQYRSAALAVLNNVEDQP